MGGRTFDAWEIVLRDKPPALREASPKATVPVLLLEDGSVWSKVWTSCSGR